MGVYCGLDFGTSNTSVALYREDEKGTVCEHKVIANEPSVLFFPATDIFDDRFFVGREAMEQYSMHNMQGRFIKSLKSLLPYSSYNYTLINKRPYQPDDLLMYILKHFKKQVDRYLKENNIHEEIKGVCIGRPVYFSKKAKADQLAQQRLLNAAHMAGFPSRTLFLEPLAALYGYHITIKKEDIVLIADLGAGTCDFTVINNMTSEDIFHAVNKKAFFTTEGVHIGGDDFDAAIFDHKLTRYFGKGSMYESWGKWLEVPVYIYFIITHWERLNQLKTSKFIEELKEIRAGAKMKEGIDNLLTLITENLSYSIFRVVEAAKILLSECDAAPLLYNKYRIRFEELITIDEFDKIISQFTDRIRHAYMQNLKRLSLKPGQVTTVILTGGSSRVRCIRTMIQTSFPGADIIFDENAFNTVALGLARIASLIIS
ncbi:MAG: Hsp70 family protein [Spirochaetales bacterium]|nr:Hsp70 family protein [Spirochaetales bacterium]